MSHDPACDDLAEHFLSEEEFTTQTARLHADRVNDLAEALQHAAESWLQANPLRDFVIAERTPQEPK